MMKRVAILVFLLAVLAQTLFAQIPEATAVPRWIRFSGQAKASQGTVGITFTLHKNQQDEAALWTETQNVKLAADGKYTVLLGSTKPDGIPVELFTSGEAQWLAIRIEGQPVQRVLLVSVPYALKAAEAETLAGHTAAEFVTTEKLTTVLNERTSEPAMKNRSGAKTNVVTDPATNFSDTNSTQVVLVTQLGTGAGLLSTSTSGYAIRASSSAGTAVYADSPGGTGETFGVFARNASTGGTALRANSVATSGVTYGVLASSLSPNGYGVSSQNMATTGPAIGVYGKSTSTTGIGIRALASATTGATTGLHAWAYSPSGTALVAQNNAGGKLISGRIGSSGTEIFAVDGGGNISAASLTSAFVQGASTNPSGYGGLFSGANGGHALSANGGAAGATSATGGSGVISTGGSLANGVSNAFGGDGGDFYGGGGDAGTGAGVSGTGGSVLNSASITAGVGGYFIGGNPNGDGLYAAPAAGGSGNAATLDGNVVITGAVSSAASVYRIDHPLDPANKYLDHVGVQSSESLNVYTGNAVLGPDGQAVVTLAKWFEAVNTDFRYQLTPIGGPATLYISREIHDGSFAIAGGTPGMKVSWTITAVRRDPYSVAHAHPAEAAKKADERGHYLHPELYGHAGEASLAAREHPSRATNRAAVDNGQLNPRD